MRIKSDWVKALKFGSIRINGFAALAPMAGVADIAFREICRSFGAAFTVGEMVSCKGMVYGDNKSVELLKVSDVERPTAVQLFGDDSEFFRKAVPIALNARPDWIDINMGCPTPKIVNNGAGSALLRNPEKCGELVRAVKSRTDLPVSVKIRAGWDKNSINAVEVAKICEQAGAAFITVHARTREQMYAPSADWSIIKSVRENVSIPVVGNGDIFEPSDAVRMMNETGVSLCMAGRGALGRPWIFRQINELLTLGKVKYNPSIDEKMDVMVSQISRMIELKGEYRAMCEARKHVAWYIKGMRGAAQLRQAAGTVKTLDEVKELAQTVIRRAEQEEQG
ncbi:MAG: tRNA dihydrouridine synthase DusB [Clostridia bacterium]|nr:tRNA dihydrouridine synthase DusB [Clostridia bacterium]